MAHNAPPGSPPSLPTTRNRLSLILQFPSTSLSKSSKSRGPGFASKKFKKRFRTTSDHAATDLTSVLSDSSDTHHCPDTPAAASSISIADSLLSTPHESLLPTTSSSISHKPSSSSLATSSPQEQVPPTTNDLSPDEKMRLMKKVRKLSRVLGEFPIPVEENLPSQAVTQDAPPSLPRVPPGSPSSSKSSPSSSTPTLAAEKRASLRRSFTVGYNLGSHLTQAVHRVKSFQSLYPPLTISPSTSTPPSSPMTPITFSWPTESPFTSPARPAPERQPSPSIGPLESDLQDTSHSLTRNNSNASSIVRPGPSPEQLQRARVSKLSRQLGESVPPHILRRAASPPPRTRSPLPSLSPSPPATQSQSPQSSQTSLAVLDATSLPRRSSSLRRKGLKRSTKNRLSLDIRALAGISSGPPTAPLTSTPPSPKGPSKSDKAPLRRAKSMWTRKRLGGTDVPLESEDHDAATLFRKGSMEFSAMTDRQKLLNVRRAQKMTQLFGDKPPTALFQITNITPADPTTDVDHEEDPLFRRNSLATIISLSTSGRSLSPPLSTSLNNSTTDTRNKVRNSYMSLSSVITTSSEAAGVTTTSIVHLEQEQENPSSSKVDVTRPSTPSLARDDPPTPSQSQSLPLSVAPSASSQPATNTSPTPGKSPTAKRVPPPLKPSTLSPPPHKAPPSPRTPPPFSDIIMTSRAPSVPSLHSPTSTPESRAEFHVRQRRAAKLSKFFGVGVGDLADVLPSYPAAPTGYGAGYSPPGTRDGPSVLVTTDSTSSSINGDHKGPLLYLSHGQNTMQETDMYDAIDRLRRMKSV